MLNFILTTLWLASCTYGGYWLGMLSEKTWVGVLCAVIGLFLGLILRFCPKAIGEVFGGIFEAFT